ncbi:glycosyltransferase family 2 protein [Curtanaerobium respiraculi]|uniref:glycosyltransferase family 2 protein n=1 Tax=Curtanaerobium respiraculi TaxID=2949669 RepID=UPI0024B37C78|nr:glycosyltransferase family 2 protein [Curtanaerobium respiraculi]
MRFGTLTRGRGKIFQVVEAEIPEGGKITAISTSANGNDMPAILAKRPNAVEDFVLILPALRTEQTITVSVLDRMGAACEVATRKVGHIASALTSKYNTLSKADVGGVRNVDEGALEEEAYIWVDRITGFGIADGRELVHAYVSVACSTRQDADVPPHVEVFDRQGEFLHATRITVLDDTVEPVYEHADYLVRRMEISFRKPAGSDAFFVRVAFPGSALPDGFVGMEPWSIEEARIRFSEKVTGTGQFGEYEKWFFARQRQTNVMLAAQRRVRFEYVPLFSIIVPLYKTPRDFFEEMLDSVLSQTYGRFELILVNASPEDGELLDAVDGAVQRDSRIKSITLEGNRGISLNTNEGIRAARGDFLCFFDHDDVLEPGILFEYVSAINRYPETDLLYCDEDKLRDGHYVDGFLKPDFSWELLATNNYICHLLTVRKSIVDEVELSDDDVSGAQDWDMTMKVAEKARNIFHVRKVLYHWRMHAASAAAGADAKPWTHIAGEKAVQRHFDRIGIPVSISDGHTANMHRIDYILPDHPGRVSIIIPTKDHTDLLDRLLRSLFKKSTYDDYEVILIENNSEDDETFAYYEHAQREHAQVKVATYSGKFNFSAICNFGAERASGDYFLFLNNDMEVITPNWMERLMGPMQRPEVGCTGARLLYPDGTIQHIGVVIPRSAPLHVACTLPSDYPFYFGIVQNAREVSAVTGACMMVKRSAFEDVGGFDEGFAVAYNDVDFCLRLQDRGHHVVMEPNAELFHFESASRGLDYVGKERRVRNAREAGKFQTRWANYLGLGDPLYGMNIAAGSAYYGLNWEF